MNNDVYDQKREEFLKLCKLKHEEGSIKYGETWKDDKSKDWYNESIAELADAVNYISFLAVKIQRVKEQVECPQCKGIMVDDLMTEKDITFPVRRCSECGYWR